MNGSKLRIFLIAMLVVVNILFIKLYYDSLNSKTNINEKTLNNTVEILANKGVKVLPSVIDTKKPDNNILSYNSVLFNEDSDDLQKIKFTNSNMLLSYFENCGYKIKNLQFNCFRIPNGNAISVETDKGRIAYATFNGHNEFKYTYEDEINYFDLDYLNGVFEKAQVGYKEKRIINRFLGGFSSKMPSKSSYKIAGQKIDEDTKEILLFQMYDNVEINNNRIVLGIKDDKVVCAYGFWNFSGFEEKYSENLIDGVNALFFDEVVKSKAIISQKLVYVDFTVDDNEYLYVPSWKIVLDCDDGKKQVIYDAVTGNLYKSETIKSN